MPPHFEQQLSEPIQGKLFWYFFPGLHNTKIQAPPSIKILRDKLMLKKDVLQFKKMTTPGHGPVP